MLEKSKNSGDVVAGCIICDLLNMKKILVEEIWRVIVSLGSLGDWGYFEVLTDEN